MKVYTVQKGDSLWKISKKFGVTLDELIAANKQIANPDQIDVGTLVTIPDHAMGSGGAVSGNAMTGNEEASTSIAIQPPSPSVQTHGTPASVGDTPLPAAPSQPSVSAPAYPSVPKWGGLWKYVVKHGDSMFKIAKQVGVTLDQLKAANPQVSNPDAIYSGQVLNIPSAGLKPKHSNPGHSAPMSKEQLTAPMSKEQLTAPMSKEQFTAPMSKEQLTAPFAGQPMMPKEILTLPKEMTPVEKTMITAPVVVPPQPAPISPIEMNIQYAPHMNYAPHEENVQVQQVQMPQPAHHYPMMMYIPVSYKKKKHKCKKHHKCCRPKKHCKCGHMHMHHVHPMYHPHHELVLQQHMNVMHGGGMGMMPKTFYREED